MQTWSITLHGSNGVISTVDAGESQFVIGTETASDVFTVHGEGVMARHAWVWISDAGLQVEDLGKGTWVNGYQIHERVQVEYPASVQVGEVTLVIEIKEPQPVAVSPTPSALGVTIPQRTPTRSNIQTTTSIATNHSPSTPANIAPVNSEYTLVKEIARGGMGRIYFGEDLQLERQVAVKVSSVSEDGEDPRFSKEAKVLAQLAHPNIVPIYNIGVDAQSRPFYSMKLIKGRTLQAVLNDIRDGEAAAIREYPRATLLTIFRKVCDAMMFAHSKRILHRDLKPENIMVGEYGEVLVMDWGLAKILGEQEEDHRSESGRINDTGDYGVTMEGEVMGTPQYMSPEQAQGMVAELDLRSDIYSLGGILYATLTLRPPIEGTSLDEVLGKVRSGTINAMATKRGAREVELDKSPTALGAGVPEALQAVTMKAMATDRERRYARVEELVADLEAYQNGFATRAEDAGAFRKLLLAMQRNKVATVAALVIMVLSAGFVLKITASERRANQSLARLQEAAPIFAEHSQSLIEDAAKNPKALEEALQKIDYAIELDPLNVRYQLLKGGVLQTLRRLDEAEGLYRSVLNANPTNEEAKLNLTVCQAVLAEPKENGALSNSAVRKLARALLEQNRIVESLVLSKASQGAGKEVLDALGAAIKNAGVKTNLPALDTDGTLRLSLNDAGLSRLNFLQGYPIHHLEINHAKTITDFSVLHTLALKTLVIGEHGKTGFNTEFIRGLNLRVLRLPASITDLSPLRGMALEQFQHGYRDKFDGDVGKKGRRERGNQIKGLETLKGMPLRSVRFAAGSMLGALDMLDSGSLESLEIDKCVCESLERLKNLPISKLSIQNLEAPILQDLNFLKDLKSLEKLDASENQSLEDISGLSGLKLKELILDGTAISNFTDLGEMPLEKISAQESRVVDLSGIVGLSKLTQLDLDRTDISDVSPLARLNLNVLSLSGCNRVASVAPLASIKSLREVLLPVLSADVEALRGLSNLKLITYGSGEFATKHADSTKQNPRDFWKMHDLEKQLRAGTPDGRLFPSKFPYMEQRFPGARSFKGRWLYFVRGKFTWHEAEKLARGMGGRLATMGNLDQHRDIRTFLMQGRLLETEGDACWLGNTIDPKTGRWLTPAGTEYIKKMWSGGEPAQEDNMGKKATVLAFANSAKLNASPNTCALSAENKFVVGFLVEWKD